MTFAFGDSDIPALLADFGVDITVGGITTKALLDVADEEMLELAKTVGSSVVGKAIVFTFQTSALPAVDVGQELVSEQVTYTIRQRMRGGDGALTKLLCLEG